MVSDHLSLHTHAEPNSEWKLYFIETKIRMTKLFSSSKFSVGFELYYLVKCKFKMGWLFFALTGKNISKKLQYTHNFMMMKN